MGRVYTSQMSPVVEEEWEEKILPSPYPLDALLEDSERTVNINPHRVSMIDWGG